MSDYFDWKVGHCNIKASASLTVVMIERTSTALAGSLSAKGGIDITLNISFAFSFSGGCALLVGVGNIVSYSGLSRIHSISAKDYNLLYELDVAKVDALVQQTEGYLTEAATTVTETQIANDLQGVVTAKTDLAGRKLDCKAATDEAKAAKNTLNRERSELAANTTELGTAETRSSSELIVTAGGLSELSAISTVTAGNILDSTNLNFVT